MNSFFSWLNKVDSRVNKRQRVEGEEYPEEEINAINNAEETYQPIIPDQKDLPSRLSNSIDEDLNVSYESWTSYSSNESYDSMPELISASPEESYETIEETNEEPIEKRGEEIIGETSNDRLIKEIDSIIQTAKQISFDDVEDNDSQNVWEKEFQTIIDDIQKLGENQKRFFNCQINEQLNRVITGSEEKHNIEILNPQPVRVIDWNQIFQENNSSVVQTFDPFSNVNDIPSSFSRCHPVTLENENTNEYERYNWYNAEEFNDNYDYEYDYDYVQPEEPVYTQQYVETLNTSPYHPKSEVFDPYSKTDDYNLSQELREQAEREQRLEEEQIEYETKWYESNCYQDPKEVTKEEKDIEQGFGSPHFGTKNDGSFNHISNSSISYEDVEVAGQLIIYIGGMFSGKSTAGLMQLSRMADCGFKCLYINHSSDNRVTESSDPIVTTHNSQFRHLSDKIDGVKAELLFNVDVRDYDYVFVDELQFFHDGFEAVLTWIDQQHKNVIVASLDGDAYRRKFGDVLDLIPHADQVTKLTAFCDVCRDRDGVLVPAPFTARMINDSTEAKLVGGRDYYRAMCRKCHNRHISETVEI